jgi:hypothetical protein
MQSYTSYKVSEFLKDRLPYIPPVNETPLMDPEQVAIAYNERAIPKLADLLIKKDLDSNKRKDALHTLNELVSNQETKVEMINNNVVLFSSNLMADDNFHVRCEAALLVGSLLFLDMGRKQFDSREGNYKIMQSLIFDDNLTVRECVGWLIYRFSIHKDGYDMLYTSNSIYKIVDAFNFYSSYTKIKENYTYLLYILEAFINLSLYDFGIIHMLDKGLLLSFNEILIDKDKIFSSQLTKGIYGQIRELILSTLKNIVLIKEGKSEAIKQHLIITISNYLTSSIELERLYSVSFMMGITNLLEAKNQICNFVHNNKFEILEKICSLLEDGNPDIKTNSILSLRILSQLPIGFLKIVDILYDKLTILDEVFEKKALNGLAELLPKLSKYKNPPHVEKELMPKYAVKIFF